MADPINYCSWLASSFCITQSEWAAWTQAVLTVATFAVALWRQELAAKNAAHEKADAAKLLEEERRKTTLMRARATAISLRSEITRFASVMEAVMEEPLRDTPSATYKAIEPHLSIRLRATEALDLMGAADSALKVVHGAQGLYTYLLSCRNLERYDTAHLDFLRTTAQSLFPIVERAEKEVGALLYITEKEAADSAGHAAS
ncbi:hypothetical protein [Stenotrophomonas sp. GD03958]|uniref:hypothetical protein n=1 Tax=Stenotrophomonas sp. GD03958 TaxID=2975411 RepID=UPI002447EB67|nr:hypothetical protein [Stenotrophomonas sp. GD03958]MDH1192506.1 hypothetical protein [Stenotrophomonas sp. GD03958]